jgi:hypothetical protein
MQRSLAALVISAFLPAFAGAQEPQKPSIDQFTQWLMRADQELREVPFSEVVLAATGRRVLPIDAGHENDRRVVKSISEVLDVVMQRMNATDSPVQNVGRINEASSHFEDMLREKLNQVPGFSCDFPRTAEDRVQRSGYPDLKLIETATKRVFYLDPKLYAAGSRDSSFRTFYFEPKVTTNKVRDDAVHLLVGFEHEPKSNGHWKFTRWDLVDLSRFKVRLKAEFQASNRDIYQPQAIVATSSK